MSASNTHDSPRSTADMIGHLRKKGVRLWSEDGQLRYKAPKGALTRGDIEQLSAVCEEILALLESEQCEMTRTSELVSPQTGDYVPLAFTQLQHWQLNRLGERPSFRQIASATLVRGRLNGKALEQSAREMSRRHQALRMRIVRHDGGIAQQVMQSDPVQIEFCDLTTLSAASQLPEVHRHIEQLILYPIDVAVGPMVGIRLLQLNSDEHVLIVALDHLIADAHSMGILMRDLFAAYEQTVRGEALSLPQIRAQFTDYAAWQQTVGNGWLERHRTLERMLRRCGRLRFPEDRLPAQTQEVRWSSVPFEIDAQLRAALAQWCRTRRTTLVMSVLTAYVALVSRWCNAPETIIQFQSDGRVSPQIENTVGYFASALYVRVRCRGEDSFVELLSRVTAEYCRAYDNADCSYIAAQVPRPDCARNPLFNWIPQRSTRDMRELEGTSDAITCEPMRFAHPMLKTFDVDHEPMVLFYDDEMTVRGEVLFQANRIRAETMQRFVRSFLAFIETQIRQPDTLIGSFSLWH